MTMIKLNRKNSKDEFDRISKDTHREIKNFQTLQNFPIRIPSFSFPIFYGCGISWNNSKGPITLYVLQENLFSNLDHVKALNFVNKVPKMKDRLSIYSKLAEGLADLHLNEYVYGDLKPKNIKININPSDTDFDFTNLHFKLSNFHYTSKEGDAIIGCTPMYTSPEVINGENKLNRKQDIWSFGITIASIESKNVNFLFGVPVHCFSQKFTSNKDCKKKIEGQDPVSSCESMILERVKNVFGNDTEFGELMIRTVAYKKEKRPNARYLSDEIKKYIKDIEEREKEENRIMEEKEKRENQFMAILNSKDLII